MRNRRKWYPTEGERLYAQVREEMERLETKVLGGDLLFFRGDNDCLTISRGTLGVCVDNVEGEWTELEQEVACGLYRKSEAAKR